MKTWVVGGVVAVMAVGAGLYFDRVSVAAEGERPGPGEPTVRAVKRIREDLKDMRGRIASIEDELRKLNEKSDLLLASEWEYRTQTVFGGDSRAKLAAILARMGKEKFVYVGQTSDGLYIFKRRIIKED